MSEIDVPVQSALSEHEFNALWAHADLKNVLDKTSYDEHMASVMGSPSDKACAGNDHLRRQRKADIAHDIVYRFSSAPGKSRANYARAHVNINTANFLRLSNAFGEVARYQSDMVFPITRLMTEMVRVDARVLTQQSIDEIIPGIFLTASELLDSSPDHSLSFTSQENNQTVMDVMTHQIFGIDLNKTKKPKETHPGHRHLTGPTLVQVAHLIPPEPFSQKGMRVISFLKAASQINPDPFNDDIVLRNQLSISLYRTKEAERAWVNRARNLRYFENTFLVSSPF